MAEVNPWLNEIIQSEIEKKEAGEVRFYVRDRSNTDVNKTELIPPDGSLDNPPITFTHLSDHGVGVEINLAGTGKIKDPKPYRRRLFQYTRKEAAKEARELLKT